MVELSQLNLDVSELGKNGYCSEPIILRAGIAFDVDPVTRSSQPSSRVRLPKHNQAPRITLRIDSNKVVASFNRVASRALVADSQEWFELHWSKDRSAILIRALKDKTENSYVTWTPGKKGGHKCHKLGAMLQEIGYNVGDVIEPVVYRGDIVITKYCLVKSD